MVLFGVVVLTIIRELPPQPVTALMEFVIFFCSNVSKISRNGSLSAKGSPVSLKTIALVSFFNINKYFVRFRIVSAPTEVKPGDSFDLEFEVYYIASPEHGISGVSLTLMIDFGSSQESFTEVTDTNGIARFESISVPEDATKISIQVLFTGNLTFLSSPLEFSINLGEPSGRGIDPILMIIILIIVLGLVVVVVKFSRSKKKKIIPTEKEVEEEEKQDKEKVGKESIPEKKVKKLSKKALIEQDKKLLKNTEIEAVLAANKNDYILAARKYRNALEIATSILELGVKSMEKEVNKLTEKVKEYEEMQKSEPEPTSSKEQQLEDVSSIKYEDIPKKKRENITKNIINLLSKEKEIKSIKDLVEKVHNIAKKKKITITEEELTIVINQLHKDNKIKFNKKEGWKI